MKPRDYNPDELKGVRSAPVPGVPGFRADERGRLWRLRGGVWERYERLSSTIRMNGRQVLIRAHRMVCSAWHGEPGGRGWSVRFLDGNRENLRPKNLEWSQKRVGRPRTLTKWKQADALERAEAGEQLTDLAREFGVSVATMTNLCKNYVRRGRSVAAVAHHATLCPPEQRAEAVRQRLAGRKATAVSRRFGISTTLLGELVKRAKESQCTPSA
ncbi:HNH endonuclease [Gemmata sp. G18]|uniref:HNH endonuclease n=1 Tax=Gemmata palustris TaxID=2822762 RepID=A0ABS5BVG9_9BACT|nr:helix-turn-helix domain-containing protein [Gemmata palustris]MBP3957730.1 HNH endonuclease [Gemmata palustris]